MRVSIAGIIGIFLAASLPAVAGAAGHPRGSAVAGGYRANNAPQWPSLLAGYGGVRPPFAVPAVDYYVGVPAGALKDPTAPGALPACATYEPSFHAVLVGASNCVLDRYDFTKGGGLQVQVPNGVSRTTIERSRFGLGGNAPFSTSLLDFRGSGLTVTNSTFEGIGQDPAYFDTGASGTIAFVHNYFYDLSGDGLDFGSSEFVVVEHNAFVQLGMNAESHPDPVQFCGGALAAGSHESYNLVYQPVGVASTGEQGIQVSVQCGGTIDGYSADHNTVIANNPSSLTMSYSVASNGNRVRIANNYVDASGAYGAIYPFAKGNGTAVCRGNVSLTAGSEWVNGQTYTWNAGSDIAGNFGAFTCR
jgi:hypothetical protein